MSGSGYGVRSFEGLEGSIFRVRGVGSPADAFVLDRVQPMPAPPGSEQFSLYFRRTGEVLAQGVCLLEHDDLGELDLFLVPVAREVDTVEYEACFSLLEPRSAERG